MFKDIFVNLIASILTTVIVAVAGIVWRAIVKKRRADKSATEQPQATNAQEVRTENSQPDAAKPAKVKKVKAPRSDVSKAIGKAFKIIFMYVLPALIFVASIVILLLLYNKEGLYYNTQNGILYICSVVLIAASIMYAIVLAFIAVIRSSNSGELAYRPVISVILTIVIVLVGFGGVIFDVFFIVNCVDNTDGYVSHDGGVVYISGSDGLIAIIQKTSPEVLEIPEKVGGRTVYRIKTNGINQTARRIVIPSTVTDISDALLSRCVNLEELEVAEGNPIYHSAGNCIIKTATKTLVSGCKNSVIPTDGSVTEIGGYAFNECRYLTEITIPDGVLRIKEQAFSRCYSLMRVTFPKTVFLAEDSAFSECYSLFEVCNDTPVTLSREALTHCTDEHLWHAYKSTEGSSYLNFDYDDYVFYSVGSSHYLIKYLGIDGAPVLPEDFHGEAYQIGPYAFYNLYLSTVTIPECVTELFAGAFADCYALTAVTLPQNLTRIGDKAFRNCVSLKTIVIPTSVVKIGSMAFSSCRDLTVVIFENVKGWSVKNPYSSAEPEKLSYYELTDRERVIKCLTDKYVYCVWTRS